MDLATVVGLVVAFLSLGVGYWLEGGDFLALIWHPSALLIILGGTMGMTVVGAPMATLRQMGRTIALAFFPRQEDAQALVNTIVGLAEKARKEGLLALQDDVARLTNPLLARGLNMIVDGTDPDAVRESLETQVNVERQRTEAQAAVLEAAGGYSPTAGIIGTVMGLIIVLGNLGSDTRALGQGIATAFSATFFGILLANVFWLPLGHKVKAYARERSVLGQMIIAGLVSLQTGENPRTMREKLEVYAGGPAPGPAPAAGGGQE